MVETQRFPRIKEFAAKAAQLGEKRSGIEKRIATFESLLIPPVFGNRPAYAREKEKLAGELRLLESQHKEVLRSLRGLLVRYLEKMASDLAGKNPQYHLSTYVQSAGAVQKVFVFSKAPGQQIASLIMEISVVCSGKNDGIFLAYADGRQKALPFRRFRKAYDHLKEYLPKAIE